jgi:hypothetical protein
MAKTDDHDHGVILPQRGSAFTAGEHLQRHRWDGHELYQGAMYYSCCFRSVTALQLSVACGPVLAVTRRHLLPTALGQVASAWSRVL